MIVGIMVLCAVYFLTRRICGFAFLAIPCAFQLEFGYLSAENAAKNGINIIIKAF